VEFIHRNTKKSIALKTEYLYLEDVKTAMNIYHLETNIQSKKWMLQMIKTNGSQDNCIPILENSIDKDRHKLQKMYKIKL
jgi:hypothetical protein